MKLRVFHRINGRFNLIYQTMGTFDIPEPSFFDMSCAYQSIYARQPRQYIQSPVSGYSMETTRNGVRVTVNSSGHVLYESPERIDLADFCTYVRGLSIVDICNALKVSLPEVHRWLDILRIYPIDRWASPRLYYLHDVRRIQAAIIESNTN